MKKQILFLILTTIMGLTFFTNPEETYANITWKAQSSYPTGLAQIYNPAVRFAEKVEKLSGGELVIKMYPGDAIVPSKKVFESVSTGVINMGMTWSGWWVGMFKSSVLLANAYPDALQMREMMAWIASGGGMELWNEVYEGHGVKVLHPYAVQGSEILSWSNKPINSLEDFKGLKFRTVGIWGRVLERLGAKVVSLSGGEVYTAMERGVIDALEFNTPQTDMELGLYEIAKYVTLPGIHQPAVPLETLVNERSWEKLPDHLKLIVEMALKETCFESMNETMKQDAEAMQFIRNQKDIVVSKLSPEIIAEIVKLANEELDKDAAVDPMFAKILKSQRDFRKLVEPYSELISLPYTYAK